MENPLARDLDHVLSHTEELWAPTRGERFFLTGGTGFVGTWLTESLLWANRRLSLGISAVLLTRNPEAFRQRSPHLAGDPAVTLWAGDGATFAYPDGAFPLVVHAATEGYFPPDAAHPAATLDLDLAATRRVLELARTRGARRLLFTSSGAVYGKQPPALRHIPEDYTGAPPPTDTSSAYGQGKRISEYLCACYSQVHDLEATIVTLALRLDSLFAGYHQAQLPRQPGGAGPGGGHSFAAPAPLRREGPRKGNRYLCRPHEVMFPYPPASPARAHGLRRAPGWRRDLVSS